MIVKNKNNEFITADKAIRKFDGIVNYFDTNDSLPQLFTLASAFQSRHALVCCGAGDQALTLLGAGVGKDKLWVVDTNPAQVFLLAAKMHFLKKNKKMPDFSQLKKLYPRKITAAKMDIRLAQQLRMVEKATGKIFMLPEELSEKYVFAIRSGMCVNEKSGPYWQKDSVFISRVSARLNSLRLACMDIFDSPNYFKPKSLDLIYLSDILWTESSAFYQEKLKRVINLLRPGGVIITHRNSNNIFLNRGFLPIYMFVKQAKKIGLKVEHLQPSIEYFVMRRMA